MNNCLKINEIEALKNSSQTINSPHLMFSFHGYGTNGANMMFLGPVMQQEFPFIHFISPNGCQPNEYDAENFQWFSLSSLSEPDMLRGVAAASIEVNKIIDLQLKKYNIPPENLILSGFSQGGMLAIHLGLMRKIKPKAVICYSGSFIHGPNLASEIKSMPKILMIHGAEDQVISIQRFNASVNNLINLDIDVTRKIIPEIGHTISEEALDISKKFLHNALLK